MPNLLAKSYSILSDIRLPHGLYLASPSEHYSYVWMRDSVYISLPFLNKTCQTYERTYHRFLDMFKEYEWKLDIHTKEKPSAEWQYIHARYCANEVKELAEPWGHCQHDAVGALLWGIGEGESKGKKIIRDESDRDIVQKLVWYLETCRYWDDPDNGMWEEWREMHASSIGACISGLKAVSHLVQVPESLILKGYEVLKEMELTESVTRPIDLSQLSLIYPHRVYNEEEAKKVLQKVEDLLLKELGVIRYQGDSYYSTKEADGRDHPFEYYYGTEAEWCFGLPWLALCHMELGNYEKAKEYIEWTESVMLEDGSLPELYYAGTNKPNPNTPLGWGNAMYIVAKEKMSVTKL
jgi:GH15 family glucan-1,4-alpha-glucosidase